MRAGSGAVSAGWRAVLCVRTLICQTALALDQDIESMRAIPGRDHVGLPVDMYLSRDCPVWALLDACLVFDSLTSLSVGPLSFPLRMVERQSGNEVRGHCIDILMNRFV